MAEVLITLAIIGVVAALTIPTVITNYRKNQAATQLKKVYTTMQQAINMAIAENGSMQTWGLKNGCSVSTPNDVNKFYNYISPHLKASKTNGCKESPNTLGGVLSVCYCCYARKDFGLPDGSCIMLTTWYTNPAFYVDLNGIEKPNVLGKDTFIFVVNPDGKVTYVPDHGAPCLKNVGSYGYPNYASLGCTRKIMLDGWQIKYDW